MNTLTKAIAITTLTLSSIGIASASNMLVAKDSNITTKLCLVASEGNKAKLSVELKKAGLSKSYVTENVKCNNLNMVNFVEQYGNNAVQINNFLTSGKYSNNSTAVTLAAR
ncbi:DUF3718 domain-containing protein [Paraglaciecola sp.]|uniref:DUF3718 domain-containing protein n=1 Tax=Paraglaciecola sp. TaxID=1920173 RepID=UPI003F4AD538